MTVISSIPFVLLTLSNNLIEPIIPSPGDGLVSLTRIHNFMAIAYWRNETYTTDSNLVIPRIKWNIAIPLESSFAYFRIAESSRLELTLDQEAASNFQFTTITKEDVITDSTTDEDMEDVTLDFDVGVAISYKSSSGTHYKAHAVGSPGSSIVFRNCDVEDCTEPTLQLIKSVTCPIWKEL